MVTYICVYISLNICTYVYYINLCIHTCMYMSCTCTYTYTHGTYIYTLLTHIRMCVYIHISMHHISVRPSVRPSIHPCVDVCRYVGMYVTMPKFF